MSVEEHIATMTQRREALEAESAVLAAEAEKIRGQRKTIAREVSMLTASIDASLRTNMPMVPQTIEGAGIESNAAVGAPGAR